MNYDEQIKIIQAAKDGLPILGRKKNDNSADWDYFDNRVRDKRYYYHNNDILFNFVDYEYKVLSNVK